MLSCRFMIVAFLNLRRQDAHPTSTLGAQALVGGARLLSALPTPISRTIAKANNKGLRPHDSMRVKDYPCGGR